MNINIKNSILIINFDNKTKMNQLLDNISNMVDGIIKNREGHNFPADLIPPNHLLSKYKNKCKYVIGIYNIHSLKHELLHAKFYLDKNYRQQILNEFYSLTQTQQKYIINFLQRGLF